MTDYKHLWQQQFDEYLNSGLDETEAAQEADEWLQDFVEQKADYEHERMKEEGHE
jgi:hypothetical protein